MQALHMFTGSLPTYHSRVQELRLRPLRAMLFHSKEGGAGALAQDLETV